jgi:hypothetical protein
MSDGCEVQRQAVPVDGTKWPRCDCQNQKFNELLICHGEKSHILPEGFSLAPSDRVPEQLKTKIGNLSYQPYGSSDPRSMHRLIYLYWSVNFTCHTVR